jgi:hypothetical protein
MTRRNGSPTDKKNVIPAISWRAMAPFRVNPHTFMVLSRAQKQILSPPNVPVGGRMYLSGIQMHLIILDPRQEKSGMTQGGKPLE